MFNPDKKTKASTSIQSLEDVLTLWRTSGRRISKQRYRVLELLWRTDEHLSAKEIYARLNKHSSAISLTAIYQNIAALSALGLLESVPSSKGRLYSKVADSHAHIKCLDTEKILDVRVNLPIYLNIVFSLGTNSSEQILQEKSIQYPNKFIFLFWENG